MSISFTEEQKAIFQFVKNESSHGIIDAVAGAGKTTTIIESAKYAGKEEQVLFCAFNTSIAKEILNKFRDRGMNRVTVKTIHALGRQILFDNNNSGKPLQLENNKYWQILKNQDIQNELKSEYQNILAVNNLDPENIEDPNDFAIKNLINRINERLIDINQKYRTTLTKEDLTDFEQMVIHFNIFNEIEVNKRNFKDELGYYFECHKILLQKGNQFSKDSMIIDYTDMIYLPYAWKLYPNSRYDFLFIDECQDLSKAQLQTAVKYGRKGSRILAVGDPNQSIYGFTGADIESFKRVKDLTKATELSLKSSFRCPKKAIEIAQTLRNDITGFKDEDGSVINIPRSQVVNLAKPGDLIISRLRAPLVILVFDFINKNIKIQIHEDEVNEIIHELKGIFKHDELNVIIDTLPNKFDDLHDKVIKRWEWIIKKNAERIIDSVERNVYIDSEKEYLRNKLAFLSQKYYQWNDECPSILELLKKIQAFISSNDNPIKLSTIHRAKGLEEDRVFIINYNDLPLNRLDQKDWEKEQELNLKYVAVTRVKEELFLVESENHEELVDEGSLFDELPFD